MGEPAVSGERVAPVALSNADIARTLSSLAQLLSAQGANPYKVKAYRRAAETILGLGDSIDEKVRREEDLTQYPGIGNAISSAIREIVLNGKLRQLETLRSDVAPEIAALSEYPRLDPKRVLRIYRELGISSLGALKEKLESGELARKLGPRLDQHVRQALIASDEILLFDADPIAAAVERYLRDECGVRQLSPAGEYRRRVELVGEISFIIQTDDVPAVIAKLQRFGGKTERVSSGEAHAVFRLPAGILLRIEAAPAAKWGVALILGTGSEDHLQQLEAASGPLERLRQSRARLPNEPAVYRKLGLHFVPPELREGRDEVERAAAGTLPALVSLADLRGDLHMHSTASDGAHSIERMAAAARERGYAYIGIADHSQSLKIAGGVSEADLWAQIRRIDRLNERLDGIRILKSAEVDILADGALDYPDELLRELDYTVCSIHSRFGLGKEQQTARILRAMDNPYFTLLGHATGRLLLRRPGYEIDIERVIAHARQRGCFFEINSSPDRLDLSAKHARMAREAGIRIAINTDAHSVGELDFMRCGVDQARRAGLAAADVLNCLPVSKLLKVFSVRR